MHVLIGECGVLTRKPVEVYRGLLMVRFDSDAPTRMEAVIGQFSDQELAGERLSTHLTRFLGLWSRLTAYLDSREMIGLEDITVSVDVLDYFTSTTKWWTMTREKPWLIMRPPSRDPREFMKSIDSLQVDAPTLSRISGATDKLLSFLEEHNLANANARLELCATIRSAWTLLSAFMCKSQGRNITIEADFEVAYDIVRILLFYISLNDYRALTAIRTLATNPKLPAAARIGFSPGFEHQLDSSVAARLERLHGGRLAPLLLSAPGSSRTILTNSLRLLGQLQAADKGLTRIEEEHYDSIIMGAIGTLERTGVSPTLLGDERAALNLFNRLRPEEGVPELLNLMIRRLEGLIVDSTGNRDFLLQYARLVPRLVALLLLLASGTKTSSEYGLQDADLKRGLILFNALLED